MDLEEKYLGRGLNSPEFKTVAAAIGAGPDLSAGTYGNYRVTDTGSGQRIVARRSPQEIQDEAIQTALRRQAEANRPAIDTLKQRDPLITQTFQTERERLGGERTSLQDRYAKLLEDVKGQGAKRETAQTRVTARELGRRGISSQSGLFDQELQGVLDPIRSDTQSLTKDIGLEQETGLRGIRDLLASLTNQEATQRQTLAETIANLQAGGAQTAIAQGLDTVRQNVADALSRATLGLQRKQLEANQASSAADRKLQQDIFDMIQLPESKENIKNIQSLIANRGLSSSNALTTNPHISAIIGTGSKDSSTGGVGNYLDASEIDFSGLDMSSLNLDKKGNIIFDGFVQD